MYAKLVRSWIVLLTLACGLSAEAGVTGKALREALEYAGRKFGKEVAEEGAERLSLRMTRLAAQHGDKGVLEARRNSRCGDTGQRSDGWDIDGRLAVSDDEPDHFPRIVWSEKKVAPVAESVGDLDEVPGLQLFQAHAHVRARDAEGFGYLIGM